MFNLEQAIIEWRRQMLAAGIPAPIPLDELEAHLRDDIQRAVQGGDSEEQAFCVGVERLGSPGTLKVEFAKSKPWWGDGCATGTERVLGVLWAVANVWPFYITVLYLFRGVYESVLAFSEGLFFVGLYGAQLFGGLLLFRGSQLGRSIIRTAAAALLGCCVLWILTGYGDVGWREWCGIWAVVSLVTIVLLHRAASPGPSKKLNSFGILLAVGSIVVGAQLQKWTDGFISIHRHGVHGEILFHRMVFVILALHLAGILCLIRSKRSEFSRRSVGL